MHAPSASAVPRAAPSRNSLVVSKEQLERRLKRIAVPLS
jgi:hypothetical protein